MSVPSDIIVFPEGARWVRADFHLHTAADKECVEFRAAADFEERFIASLELKGITVGVITNHNKLDVDEWRRLRERALPKGILLLPGVELSVQGGRNGLHILIVFEPDAWLGEVGAENFIGKFLNEAFAHIANHEDENTSCAWTLAQTLEKLDSHRQHGRDSFAVLAHVDDPKGALGALGGNGLRQQFNDRFAEFVLAVQKSRSSDKWNELRQWFRDTRWDPAKVEGSDGKTFADVGTAHESEGKRHETWLKLGALSFNSVRLSLLPGWRDHRLTDRPPPVARARLESICWQGASGLLDGTTLPLSPDLNVLIGVRGSGKSTVLETLRFLLAPKRDDGSDVGAYKDALPERALGSGGKVLATLTTQDGTRYRLERGLLDAPSVYRDGTKLADMRPDALLRTAYFGQDDLAAFGEKGLGKKLLDRFTGEKRDAREEALLLQIQQRLLAMAKGRETPNQIEEINAALAQAEEDLRKFKEFGLEDKLREQIAYQKDEDQALKALAQIEDTRHAIKSARDDHAGALHALAQHQPAGDGLHYAAFAAATKEAISALNIVETGLAKFEAALAQAKLAHDALDAAVYQKKEAFAQIRQGLNLRGELNPDSFIQLSRRRDQLLAQRHELEAIRQRQLTFAQAMQKDLAELRALWRSAHDRRQIEIERLNSSDTGLHITLSFCGDRAAFTDKLRGLIPGAVTKPTLAKLTHALPDGPSLYLDLAGAAQKSVEVGLNSDQIAKIREALAPHWRELLGWRSPDLVTLTYKERDLSQHSVGQRATALLKFLLSQEDFDLLLVDQPEDDLDNKTLYSEIVARLIALKGVRQLIFVTHSPTIAVLGDAEQVAVCHHAHNRIKLETGGIDSPEIHRQIIKVMEGGRDALERRQCIYKSWTR